MSFENKQREELLRLVREYASLRKILDEVGGFFESISVEPEQRFVERADVAWTKCDECEDPCDTAEEQEGCLMHAISPLRYKIEEILIDAKLYPLLGLPEDVCDLLIKSFGEKPSEAIRDYDPSKGAGILDAAAYVDRADAVIETKMQKVLEEMHFLAAKEMKERLLKLPPLFLGFHIDHHTYDLYRQCSKCYVCGFFEACCVLARSIVETTAKKFIERKGHGNCLSGKNKEKKGKGVAAILKEDLKLNDGIISCYGKVQRLADAVLHTEKRATAEEALESVKSVQGFFKHFPKLI